MTETQITKLNKSLQSQQTDPLPDTKKNYATDFTIIKGLPEYVEFAVLELLKSNEGWYLNGNMGEYHSMSGEKATLVYQGMVQY